jgi:hypothetical protein
VNKPLLTCSTGNSYCQLGMSPHMHAVGHPTVYMYRQLLQFQVMQIQLISLDSNSSASQHLGP